MLSKDFFDLYNSVSSKFFDVTEDETLFSGVVASEDSELIAFLLQLDAERLDTAKIDAMHDSDKPHELYIKDLDEPELYEDTGHWKITLSKDSIAQKLSDLADGVSLFLNKESFFSFLERLDPFQKDSHRYDNETRLFLVYGLDQPIGGEHFFAAGDNSSFLSLKANLPTSDDVHNLVHVM
ncbi:hypothetical protein AB8E32_00350 [Marinomonas polaris]|uniref:hypothetical protein n=1 Tax=Marinomonas polaris TaxID=293552 RepID=UPI003512476D